MDGIGGKAQAKSLVLGLLEQLQRSQEMNDESVTEAVETKGITEGVASSRASGTAANSPQQLCCYTPHRRGLDIIVDESG